jgi:hypothetical protein
VIHVGWGVNKVAFWGEEAVKKHTRGG